MCIEAKCKLCNETFTSLQTAQQHIDDKHPGQANAMCGLCGDRFDYYSKLRDHKDAVHPGWRDGRASITKEFVVTKCHHVNEQRGNPRTKEISVEFNVTMTPNPPQDIQGYTFFNGKWYSPGNHGAQMCNQCGLPLPKATDDPSMVQVYVPWVYGKLNEVHLKDVAVGKKYAYKFHDALNKVWQIK